MNWKLLFELEAEQNREYKKQIDSDAKKIQAYKTLLVSKNEEIQSLKEEMYDNDKKMNIMKALIDYKDNEIKNLSSIITDIQTYGSDSEAKSIVDRIKKFNDTKTISISIYA